MSSIFVIFHSAFTAFLIKYQNVFFSFQVTILYLVDLVFNIKMAIILNLWRFSFGNRKMVNYLIVWKN